VSATVLAIKQKGPIHKRNTQGSFANNKRKNVEEERERERENVHTCSHLTRSVGYPV
jgi:hypothetical protein